MRELLKEECLSVAGGTKVCDDMAAELAMTIAADGTAVGVSAAILVPTVGALGGGLIAAAAAIVGGLVSSHIHDVCEASVANAQGGNSTSPSGG